MGLLAVANKGGARMLSLSFTSLSRASSSLRSGTRICSTSSGKNSSSSERPTTTSTSTQEQLPRPDLRKLAELAKVSLTDDQIKDFQPKVDRVVDWFAQLQEVDLGDSEIKDFEVVDMAGRADLREDVPQEYENREALFSQNTEMEGDYFKLPKTAASES
jgi:aspartyl-tRNA(Asn)/glutamyl-tRNA(Gln) amidotransferase subunit C